MNIAEIKTALDKEIVRNVSAINTLLDDRAQLRNVLTKLDQDLDSLRISQERLEYIRVNFPAEPKKQPSIKTEEKTSKKEKNINIEDVSNFLADLGTLCDLIGDSL